MLDVELTIDQPPAGVAPGFTFAGTISVTSETRMLIVPTSAVSSRNGVSTVRKKLADGTISPVVVTTKYLGEGMTQILTGDVAAGDTLVSASTATSQTGAFNINLGGAAPIAGAPGMGGAAGRTGGQIPAR